MIIHIPSLILVFILTMVVGELRYQVRMAEIRKHLQEQGVTKRPAVKIDQPIYQDPGHFAYG